MVLVVELELEWLLLEVVLLLLLEDPDLEPFTGLEPVLEWNGIGE